METVLRTSDLSRSFRKIQALKGLSISLGQGEIYGLIGPDGAGKTTALRSMIGALTPDRGDTTILGISVAKSPEKAREKIGYMPQAYGLYQDLTVEENLRFYGDLQGVPQSTLEKRITELLEFIRLEKFRKRLVGNLSGGMYKKLAVACSIIHAPRILILDEPTNGVDPVSRRDLWSLLFELSGQGVTILVSTPYMDEAERCHRVGLLMDGNLIHEGDPGEMTRGIEGELFRIQTDKAPALITTIKENWPHLLLFQAGREVRIFLSVEDHQLDDQIEKLSGGQGLIPIKPVFEDVFMKEILSRGRVTGGE